MANVFEVTPDGSLTAFVPTECEIISLFKRQAILLCLTFFKTVFHETGEFFI